MPETEKQLHDIFKDSSVQGLYNTLNENGKDTTLIDSIIDTVVILERQVANSEEQIKSMKSQINTMTEMQEHPIKQDLQNTVNKLDEEVKETKGLIATIKDNIVQGCKDAAKSVKQSVKDGGVKALDNLVSFFKVKSPFQAIEQHANNNIGRCDRAIGIIEAFAAEYHNVGLGFKNMGRSLVGKEKIETPKEIGKLAQVISAPYKKMRETAVSQRDAAQKIIGSIERLEVRSDNIRIDKAYTQAQKAADGSNKKKLEQSTENLHNTIQKAQERKEQRSAHIPENETPNDPDAKNAQFENDFDERTGTDGLNGQNSQDEKPEEPTANKVERTPQSAYDKKPIDPDTKKAPLENDFDGGTGTDGLNWQNFQDEKPEEPTVNKVERTPQSADDKKPIEPDTKKAPLENDFNGRTGTDGLNGQNIQAEKTEEPTASKAERTPQSADEKKPIDTMSKVNKQSHDIYKDTNVQALYNTLNENGKDTGLIDALIDSVILLERQVANSEIQIKSMKSQIDTMSELQKHPVKKSLQNTVNRLEQDVKVTKGLTATSKDNIVQGCNDAVQSVKQSVKDGGVKALDNLVSFFKVKAPFQVIEQNANKKINRCDKAINNIETFAAEYHKVGLGLKNMGRILFGKEKIDTPKEIGILAQAISAPYKQMRETAVSQRDTVKKVIDRIERLEERADDIRVDKAFDQYDKARIGNDEARTGEAFTNLGKVLKKTIKREEQRSARIPESDTPNDPDAKKATLKNDLDGRAGTDELKEQNIQNEKTESTASKVECTPKKANEKKPTWAEMKAQAEKIMKQNENSGKEDKDNQKPTERSNTRKNKDER